MKNQTTVRHFRIALWTLLTMAVASLALLLESRKYPIYIERWFGSEWLDLRFYRGAISLSWLSDNGSGTVRSSKIGFRHWSPQNSPEDLFEQARGYARAAEFVGVSGFPFIRTMKRSSFDARLRAVQLPGLEYSSSHVDFGPPGTAKARQIRLSFWLWFVILGSIWGFRYLLHSRKMRRRIRAGLCVNCGYDLRASPDRCPECGTPVPAKPAAAAASKDAPPHSQNQV